MVNRETPGRNGTCLPAESPPLSVRLRLYQAGESVSVHDDAMGGNRQGAGVEADGTGAGAGSRAGRELTMCPVGRTPLIPLRLESMRA